MKKLLLTIAISLFSLSLLSQSCLPSGFRFYTQSQIDNFHNFYPDCTEIEGDVEISGGLINNLNGLNMLTAFQGDLEIIFCNSLINLNGLENVTYVGGDLKIRLNESLSSLNGLNNVTFVGGDLEISGQSLLSLNGLNNMDSISGSLGIFNNESLINLLGMDNLVFIGEDLTITYNRLLTNLTGLDNLITIGGHLNIHESDSLISLTGLENLSSIGGTLNIGYYEGGGASIEDLTGLESLVYIGEELLIGGNPNLTSLTGLNNVIFIGGFIGISGNQILTSLSALNNLNPDSLSSLSITHNVSLSNCAAQSICEYLSFPDNLSTVYGNAPGCNSPEEVEEACETVSIDEVSILGNITSSPNPFSTSTTLSYELRQPEKVILSIYSHLGQLIYQTQENQPQGNQQLIWNAEGFSDGIYYYRLKVGDAVANGKLVKVR